jgi:SAM-dependent methyltransferase
VAWVARWSSSSTDSDITDPYHSGFHPGTGTSFARRANRLAGGDPGTHDGRVHVAEYFADPRLAGLYDTLNVGRHDIDFHLALADELRARTVVDVGCGTGLLAVELAGRGHSVTGVDPSSGMLGVARDRPGNQPVTWIHGDAPALPPAAAELAIMTGHVAQVFLDDAAWQRNLRAIRAALAPGGRLAFESRNPAARAWERWNPADSRRRVQHPSLGTVQVWSEVLRATGDTVTFDEHHVLADGEDLRYTNTIRFPALDLLTASLTAAGFAIERGHGDWDGSPIGPTSPEFILVARTARRSS